MDNVLSIDIIISLIIISLIVFVMFRVLIKKKRPHNMYTPFDYITGQSDKEFHEALDEQEEKEKE